MASKRASHEQVVESTEGTAASMTPQRVPINAYETSGAFVIVAPLPAVTEDDVTIELRADGIRFYAELRSSGPREYAVHEWEYGGYERAVDVPDGYGSDVEASLANGQLVVRVLAGSFSTARTVRPTTH